MVIDLKITNKKTLTFATVSVLFLSVGFAYSLNFIKYLDTDIWLIYALYALDFLIYSFLIYTSIGYFLAPMFKTNYILELLLKDTLHELNIPLSVIKANLQLLRLQETESAKIKRLDRIGSACLDLTRLYKDMDYYIKKEVLYDLKEEFNIEEVILKVVDKFKSMDIKEQIICNIKPLTIHTDRHGFEKALTNLVDNAIKYNKNSNNIEILLQEKKLFVIDQGRGMDDSEIFKVFNRYYQEDSSKKGYGIGLSIVKSYCDEEKIEVKIDSKKDKGTKIMLNLENIVVE